MVPLLFRFKQDIGAGVGGVAQAGASVIDTEATNAANMQMQQIANQFNAQQAQTQRTWSAQEASKQRTFQDTEQTKAEDWNKMMSDTSIQRRVSDLRSAGINPLLAASSLGGASSPVMSGMPGSMPSGASASAAGVAHLQADPALQGLAGLKLSNAQAANITQDTQNKKDQDVIISAMGDQWTVDTSPEMLMKRVQAMAAQYDLDYAKASEANAVVEQIRNSAALSGKQVTAQGLTNQILQMDADTQRATMGTLIQMQNSVQTQQEQEARNVTAAQSGLIGEVIARVQAVMTPVATGAGAFHSAAQGAKALTGIGGALAE